MKKLPLSNSQKGQTVLIILLIMAVLLTIGISTISSSITDIKISQQTEEASRAFYVAESALEERLSLPLNVFEAKPEEGTIGGIDYQVSKTAQSGDSFLFPFKVDADDSQTIWLIPYNENTEVFNVNSTYTGSFTLYWGNNGTSEEPALTVTVVYKDGSSYKIHRYNYDPNNTRKDENKFNLAVSGSFPLGGENLKFSSAQIAVTNGVLLKLTLLYNNSAQSLGIMKASGSPSFPNQGNCFISSATVPESGITRKIKQCKLWSNLPGIFSWGLFSGGSLEKI